MIKDYKDHYPIRDNSVFIKSQKLLVNHEPGLLAEKALKDLPYHIL